MVQQPSQQRGRGVKNIPWRQTRPLETHHEDEPNTPSKSKDPPRRFLGIYVVGLVLTIFLGLSFFNREVGNTRAHAYSRKALVAPLYTKRTTQQLSSNIKLADLSSGAGGDGLGGTRQRQIANSELRQREALEIADLYLHGNSKDGKLYQGRKGPSLVELTGGGGFVNAQRAPGDPLQQSADAPQAANETAEPILKPTSVTITVLLNGGRTRTMTVDYGKVEHLAILSEGLESEDVVAKAADHEEWWSNVIDAKGALQGPLLTNSKGPTVALATAASLLPEVTLADTDDQCKIYVLDVNTEVGPTFGARACNVSYKKVWPFSRYKQGIDGSLTLPPEHYQYAAEYWISQAIRNSSRHTTSMRDADFVFVDMWCYHTAWLAYIHPLGNRNTSNPEPYMRRSIDALLAMDRFRETKGGDFSLVQPNPVMKGLFSEENMCEDLASVYNMVPERNNLCIWTQDSPLQDKSLIIPYVSSLDLDFETDLDVPRKTLMFFRGGCGNPHPSVRDLFAAGKMMRYEMVQTMKEMKHSTIQAECSCDICDNHLPHPKLMEAYRNATFCPVLPSNVQSSRRLSEAVLSGCIPVFIGPPFHTMPLASDVDYKSFAVFINVTNTAAWVNDSSPNWQQNHMVAKMWKLDAPMDDVIVNVDTIKDAITYLQKMPQEEVGRKRRAALKERFKFYYGPVPEAHGGDGRTSQLGEVLMKHMCRQASRVKARVQQAADEGVDITDSDIQVQVAAVSKQQKNGQ